MSMSTKEYYQMLKRNHMCVRCHKQDAFTLGGRAYCAECVTRNRKRGNKSYAKHRNEILVRRKERYLHAKHDACPRCGKKKDWFGEEVVCYSCRKKEARRKHKEKLMQGVNFPRGGNGFCWMCNKEPALPGKKLCQHCQDIAVKNLKKPSITVNHIWRLKNSNLKGGTYAKGTT